MIRTPRTLQLDRDGRVLVVRVANPPHNFINTEMVAELDSLTRSLRRDRSIGAVVITGAGDDLFVGHIDVSEILAEVERIGVPVGPRAAWAMRGIASLDRLPVARSVLRRTPARGILEVQRIHDVFLRMNRMDKVFLAAIGGSALGGGCDLALACDIRYMATGSAAIGFPETTLGLIPGAGGTQRLTRLLGTARTIELLLEGRPLSPPDALERGLVHHVVEPELLLAATMETARRLSRRSPASIRAAKRVVYRCGSRSLEAGLAGERRWALVAASSAEARAALAEYLERCTRDGRPPWASAETLSPWLSGTAVPPARQVEA
ncbi:MAG TPA: enoyl-CoA hydratase/isomerase family protein [Thermoleophilaceae bacterium]